MSDYRVESCILEKTNDIEQDWLELQQQAPHSYFQSWGWIGTWLDHIAIHLKPVAVRVFNNKQLVGLGIFVHYDIKRRVFIRSRVVFLNELPFAGRDVNMEFNGLLVAVGHEEPAYVSVINHLFQKDDQLDEICVGAIAENDLPLDLDECPIENVSCIVNDDSMSWQIDLESFDSGIDAYLATLSRNRRGQVRRSIQLYEQRGTIQIDEASDVEQANNYFDALKDLHTRYWESRGQTGAFKKQLWESFHRRLIQQRFDKGEVQLLRVYAGKVDIGYIYNLVLNEHVYVIQTGFEQDDDKRIMPGYVAHVFAISHNEKKGMRVYDLLYGDALYKQILCNKNQKVIWLSIQRKQLKFTIENALVGISRKARRIS